MEEILKSMGGFLGTGIIICFYAGSKMVEKYKQKKEQKDLKENLYKNIDHQNNVKIEIDKIVQKILVKTGCNRVNIFDYHNGIKTIDGVCLNFVKVTSEACDRSTASIWEHFQDRQIDPEMRLIIKRTNDSIGGYSRVMRSEETGKMRMLQKQFGTTTAYNFRLSDSIWEGVLTLIWVHDEIQLNSEQIEDIKIYIEDIKNLKNQIK